MSSVPNARFTGHAYLRVVGGNGEERRLRLSPAEVAEMLDGDKAVPVGRDPKDQNKIHRAIYSKADDECFVVVQDSTNGEVITILPFSHHGRFVLDPTQVRKMTMRLAGHEPPTAVVVELLDVFAGADTDLIVAMEVRFQDDYPGKLRTKRLLRTAVPQGGLLHEIIQDQALRKEIEIEVMNKLNWYREGTEVAGFKVHFVSNGTTSDFRWFEKDWTPRIPK